MIKRIMARSNKIQIRVVSLGGSTLINKDFSINTKFLSKFKIIVNKSKKKFIFIIGGGKIARLYVNVLKKLKLKSEDLDEVGIQATKINALFLSKYFGNSVFTVTNKISPKLINNFKKSKKSIIFVFGDKPGHTSDYDSAKIADLSKSKLVYNITNIDYVYDKHPLRYKNAKPFKDLTWKQYMAIIGTKIEASGNYPFDPVASKYCMKHDIDVISIAFNKLNDLKKVWLDSDFKGSFTRIHSF